MKHLPVIVIGSGISGLNFALRAAEKGNHVLLVTKKKLIASATNFAQGGIAAVLSQLDSIDKHVQDTLVAGAFHNNRRAVEYMVRHSAAAVTRLCELGVPFARRDGELSLTREGGHSERRIAFVSDYTGEAIEKTLIAKVRREPRITIMEHTFVADLLVKRKKCFGVRVLRKGRYEHLYGDMTVLATGGIGQLFAYTTNPRISTGDGCAMASRAGCEFKDMEFVQFHPTVSAIPGTKPFLISEAVRGEGAYLVNAQGERFMKGYDERGELAPRDIVSRAIYAEEKKGPVFLDMRHTSRSFLQTRFPKIYATIKKYGIDMAQELVPISPAAHYMCGGVKVGLRGETGVKNLYAFGEVAWTGVHGANRLASNSLLEALVFSDRIIESIPRSRQTKRPHFSLPRSAVLSKKEKRVVNGYVKELRMSMWNNVGIIRSGEGIQAALTTIERLTRSLKKLKKNTLETIELSNMLQTGGLIAQAALARKKSLGCHFREEL